MAKTRIDLRIDDDLAVRIDAQAGKGGRTAWIVGALRSVLEAGGVAPALTEPLTPTDAAGKLTLAASNNVVAALHYSQTAIVQKPSELSSLVSATRDLIRVATEYELLDAVGDLTDDPAELYEIVKGIVADAKAASRAKRTASDD